MIFGIGMDVVEIARIAAALARHDGAFARRVFTEAERRYCEAQPRPALHFAARFAAKEAVAKALGTGIGAELGWLDIEVRRSPDGRPTLHLDGAGRRFAASHGVAEVMLSLSHARDYAAAVALAIGPPLNAPPTACV